MKIGIIGAGNIGSTLARKLAASGHEVKRLESNNCHLTGCLLSGIHGNAARLIKANHVDAPWS